MKRLLTEIDKIFNPSLKLFVDRCVGEFPEYFWKAPASGSGHYHPDDENKAGGLVLHTRRVVKLCEDLAHLYGLDYREKDILIAAAILHDSWAKGVYSDSTNTNSDVFHPAYVPFRFPFKGFADRYIEESMYDEVMECVTSHSGRFSIPKTLNSDKKLPKILQTADFIASRKHVLVKM